MSHRRRLLLSCLVALVLDAVVARGDRPAPILISSTPGGCYAKSVPPDPRGRGGGTRVWQLRGEDDQPLHRFDWYTPYLALRCDYSGRRDRLSFFLVRMGRGWKSTMAEKPRAVTLGFYRDGRILAEYSRMDIATVARPFPSSVDSWRGYWRPLGFNNSGSQATFEICTIEGRILAFDRSTGEFIKQLSDRKRRCERQVRYPNKRPDSITADYY